MTWRQRSLVILSVIAFACAVSALWWLRVNTESDIRAEDRQESVDCQQGREFRADVKAVGYAGVTAHEKVLDEMLAMFAGSNPAERAAALEARARLQVPLDEWRMLVDDLEILGCGVRSR